MEIIIFFLVVLFFTVIAINYSLTSEITKLKFILNRVLYGFSDGKYRIYKNIKNLTCSDVEKMDNAFSIDEGFFTSEDKIIKKFMTQMEIERNEYDMSWRKSFKTSGFKNLNNNDN